MTQRDGMGREEGGGFCPPGASSYQGESKPQCLKCGYRTSKVDNQLLLVKGMRDKNQEQKPLQSEGKVWCL